MGDLVKIKECTRKLKKLYVKLGRLTYINNKNKINKYKVKFNEICAEIKKYEKELEELKSNSFQIDSNVIVEQPLQTVDGYNIYKFCNKCQVGNSPSNKKCIYCGEFF